MRVFWPVDIAASELPGVIVGWRNIGLDVVVVAILHHVEVSPKPAGTVRDISTSDLTNGLCSPGASKTP
jgi:hypothetical protein